MNASNRTRYTRHFYIACLLARSAAFLFLVGYALMAPESFQADLSAGPFHITPLTAVWALLMLSMISRFFPSKVESLGCQKEFSGRFRPTGEQPSRPEIRSANRGALLVLLSWLALNAVFYFGYWKGIVGERFMMCTPLMVLKGPLVLSACILSVILLLRWEITHYRHPHRFYESSNRSMHCGECQEHLCKYKRALQRAAKRSSSKS